MKKKHKSHSLISFSRAFPSIANPNLNVITVQDSTHRMPSGSCAIYESYCPSFRCECHEVKVDIYLLVEKRHDFVASVLFRYDEIFSKDNPHLDSTEEQSQFAKEILLLLKPDIVELSFLTNHRNMFRRRSHLMKKVGYDKKHPAYETLQELWHYTSSGK